MLAQRTTLFKSLDAPAVSKADQLRATGEEIIDLSVEEICSDLSPVVRDGAIAAIDHNVNRYTDTIGLMKLRHALARKVSAETAQPWSADEIAVTNGARHALLNVAMSILNPGDEVLIPAPHWTTFPTQVALAGGRPMLLETRHNNYVPQLTDLATAITSKTKAIVVNTPNNPTGAVYDRDTLAGIAQLAIERDLWIVFDECYKAFTHAPHAHQPIVSVAPQARDRTLIVNSFSSSLALSGWRIGYLAGPKSVISAVKALQSLMTSNVNIIAQHALLYYLERGDLYFQMQLERQVATARALGLSVLSNLALVPRPPAEGGIYFYLDLTELRRKANTKGREIDADDVANTLLMKARVSAASGAVFGDPSGIRLSYGIDLAQLNEGLRRLTEILNTWS